MRAVGPGGCGDRREGVDPSALDLDPVAPRLQSRRDDLPLEKRGSGHEEPRRWTRKALLQPVEDAPAVLAGEKMVRLRAYPPHGGGQRHVTAEANPIGDRHDSVVVLLRDAVVEA